VLTLKQIANKEIRELIKSLGFAQWEMGELLKIGESSFSRLLRKELATEKRQELISKINEAGEKK
jgi:predicted XRE-type DNA-binding protein